MQSKNKLMGLFKKFGQNKAEKSSSVSEVDNTHNQNVRAEKLQSAKPIAKAISALVGIYYEDKNGEVSKRKITIRRIWQRGQEVLIDGFCHEMKAPRIFMASRIQKIFDIKNKKAYSNPKQFLLSQIAAVSEGGGMGKTAASKIIASIRNELSALTFLAKIDDSFDPAEMKVILEYVRKQSDGAKYDSTEIKDYVERLYPDEECFYDAIDGILDADINYISNFVETFVKLILADGLVHDEEREFLAEMLETLREEGIELDVGF
jgi:hypothetical protein